MSGSSLDRVILCMKNFCFETLFATLLRNHEDYRDSLGLSVNRQVCCDISPIVFKSYGRKDIQKIFPKGKKIRKRRNTACKHKTNKQTNKQKQKQNKQSNKNKKTILLYWFPCVKIDILQCL